MQAMFIIFYLVPRVAASYAAYTLSGFFVLKLSVRLLVYTVASILVLGMFFLINSLFATVSPTGFLVELVLILPFLLFLLGGSVSDRYDAGKILIALNLAACVMSIISLILKGFPVKLPYVHFAPDFYFAAYGLGGSKIVTVTGFFGLAYSLFTKEKTKKIVLIACALNFLMPSYMMGIVCGLAAFAVVFYKKEYLKYYVLAALVAALPIYYVSIRMGTLNQGLAQFAGMPPKVLSYYTVFTMFKGDPQTFFFGSGLGQFSGDAAIWSTGYKEAFFQGHSIPELPGFYMSDYHDDYLGPWLSFGIDNEWAIRSSMNKPFTSLATIMGECGVPAFLFAAGLFISRFGKSMQEIFDSPFSRAILAFSLAMFLIDNWHDSIFFGWLLVLAASARKKCH